MFNEALVTVLDKTDQLGDMIRASEVYHQYKEAQQALKNDETAQSLYQAFLTTRVAYNEVQRFGRYHPDYQQIMLETRRAKRQYEMHPTVITFKQAETALQQLIDEVVTVLATSVSEHVKVDAGTPLFDKLAHGCATGESCKCKAH
ncbi:YlbF family regulator [Staphylococcus ratti]|uniref:YlbF family regulator n=1 Tax=Staphylococcus ratti TaxID=2892440 RepID=A0ABY3PAX8_9STAP|nr:YlbF family regulator [Staphylococcus ratti]UEX89441.1 YlbF family regulator [Staphylococcus ratti]